MKNKLTLLALLFCTMTITSQEKIITGTVTSASDGLPLPGVNVLVKGTTTGAQTNFDGFYEIRANHGDILVFSFVGMKTKEVTISESNAIDVALENDSSSLEEVVVIGYAGTTRKGYTGSAHKVRIRGASSATSIADGSHYSGSSPQSGQLTAGEINDLEDWSEWLSILKQKRYKNIQSNWKFNLTKKIDVVVKTEKGLPAINATVLLYDENNRLLSKSKTDAAGKVSLFKPQLDKENACFRVQVISENSVVGKKITSTYSSLELRTKISKSSNDVDVMFTIDATGSMGDEMAYLKSELNNIMSRLDKAIEKKRVALTFYRDQGDEFLVKDYDFNSNIVEVQDILKSHNAGGGGDYEEAVEEALRVSMSKSWNDNAKSRVLFLMLDAPPHFTDETVRIIKTQIQLAQEKGIKIIPIVASGANKDLEFLMRFFSISTNGTYVFLTDDSGIGNPHLKPSKDDYKVEKLNDLIVRLIEKYSGVTS